MTYEECLRSIYFDWESWLIALVALAISLTFWKNTKKGLAVVSACFGLLLASSWAYLYYEMNCVELIRP